MILVISGEQFQSFDNHRNSFEFEIKRIFCMSKASRIVKVHNVISPLMSCGVEFDDLTNLRIL